MANLFLDSTPKLASEAVVESVGTWDHRLQLFSDCMRTSVDQGLDQTATHWISEGFVLTETLSAGGLVFEAVLLSEARFSELKIKPGSIRSHQWFVAPAALLHEVAGFKFHGGMMGLGRRPPRSEVEDLLLQSKSSGQGIVITAGVKSQDNLGLIIRTAKALGWAGVVTTPDAGDPWSRRVLRQSMGASAFIPVVQSPYLGQTLTAIRHHKMTLVGAALTDSALSPEGVATVIGTGTAPRIALLLGNEHEGLTPALIEACDHLVRIPMIPGHDSLNVAVAAGILLWHWSPLRHSELDHQIVDTFQGHS